LSILPVEHPTIMTSLTRFEPPASINEPEAWGSFVGVRPSRSPTTEGIELIQTIQDVYLEPSISIA
jgi:hypothetical protein